MQVPSLHSFLGTPITFVTARVRFGLPVLGDDRVPDLLRDAWLRSAVRDRWFVGLYRVEPDRVSLLACSGCAARSVTAWTTVWKAAVAERIRERIGGLGPLWEFGLPPESVVSAADYRARFVALQAGSATTVHRGPLLGAAHTGTLWELLPAPLPEPAAVAAR
jgi:hypothetical protein